MMLQFSLDISHGFEPVGEIVKGSGDLVFLFPSDEV